MNNYNDSFFLLFKEDFKRSVEKQVIPTFKSLIETCEYKSGIKYEELSINNEIETWYKSLSELTPILSLIKEDFEEIIIHSPSSINLVNSKETITLNPIEYDSNDYQIALEIFALRNKIFWNFSNPFASFGVEIEGVPLRVTLTHHTIKSTNFSKVFIRKQSQKTYRVEDFKTTYNFEKVYREKKNIIITGATGSGKTTFLKALLENYGLQSEHILILEDTKEINCKFENWTQLISATTEKKSLKDYCHYALRMRPERMVLGEIRSREVVPFMLSMNNGHKGLMASLHANSAKDAIDRLSLLFTLYSEEGSNLEFNLISKLICQNLDYVVHLEDKRIKEVIEIKNFVNGRLNYQNVAI